MIGTHSIENDVNRIEEDLRHARAEEQARKSELKSEALARLGEPQWLLAGFLGGALLGYLLTPDGSERSETATDADERQGRHAAGEGFWHKLLDHGLVVLRTYLTALVAHHAVEKVEDHHEAKHSSKPTDETIQ